MNSFGCWGDFVKHGHDALSRFPPLNFKGGLGGLLHQLIHTFHRFEISLEQHPVNIIGAQVFVSVYSTRNTVITPLPASALTSLSSPSPLLSPPLLPSYPPTFPTFPAPYHPTFLISALSQRLKDHSKITFFH